MEWLLVSALPFIENRGGILLAVALGVNPFLAYTVSSFLSFLGGLSLYLFLGRLEPFLRRTPLDRFYRAVVDRVRKKGKAYVSKYGRYALIAFVGVPLPGSGAYTGAVLAHLFGIGLRDTLLGLLAGVFVAGAIVLTASVCLMALI